MELFYTWLPYLVTLSAVTTAVGQKRKKTGQKKKMGTISIPSHCSICLSELTQRIMGLKEELRCSEIENISEHS